MVAPVGTRLASSEHISCPSGFGFEYLTLDCDALIYRAEKRGDDTGRHFEGEVAAKNIRRRDNCKLIKRGFLRMSGHGKYPAREITSVGCVGVTNRVLA